MNKISVVVAIVGTVAVALSGCACLNGDARRLDRDQKSVSVSNTLGAPEIRRPGGAYGEDCRGYAAGPSIAVAPNGRLWATWHAGRTAGEDKNGYIVLATSEDDGRSWTDVAVADPDGEGPRAMSDPQVWVDPDGHLRWSFTERMRKGEGTANYADVKGRTCLLGQATIANANVVPKTLPQSRCLGRGVMMGKPSVLSDGTWLLPVARWHEEHSSGAMVSNDRGETWTWRGGATLAPEERDYDEHSIVERRDGTLHCFSRCARNVFHAVSPDRGRTWTESPEPRILQPSARFLVRRLASGNWLMVKHGGLHERIGRSHLTAFISEDEGRSWKGGLLLDARKNVSYPDADQRSDGLVYVVYDYERTSAKEVSFATFTEADVLAGRNVSGRVSLRRRICGGSFR